MKDENTTPEATPKHQVVYVLPGASPASMDKGREGIIEVFGSHDENITATLTDSYSSNEGLAQQASLRSEVASPAEKAWKDMIRPVNSTVTSLLGYSEEAHLHNAEFLFAAQEGQIAPEAVQERLAQKAAEAGKSLPQTDAKTVEAPAENPAHILAFGHCQGVKGGIIGMINSWYAEALQVQHKRQQKPQATEGIFRRPNRNPLQIMREWVAPDRQYDQQVRTQMATNQDVDLGDQLFPGTERISLLLLDAPEWQNGNLMSDAAGERIPLSEKLKLIEAMAVPEGETPKPLFDVTVISRRTNEAEKAKLAGQEVTLVEYKRDPALNELIENFPVHHVNMGFRHLTKRRPQEAKAVLLFNKQKAQKALAYRQIAGESDADKAQRIQEALSGCLADVALTRQLSFTEAERNQPNFPDVYRKKALEEALFDIDNCPDYDVYDHLITPNNYTKLVMFQKLGYVSDDLMRDVEALIEKRELKILLEYCEGEIQETAQKEAQTERREDALDLLTFVDGKLKDQLKATYQKEIKAKEKQLGRVLSSQEKLDYLKDKTLKGSNRMPFATSEGKKPVRQLR